MLVSVTISALSGERCANSLHNVSFQQKTLWFAGKKVNKKSAAYGLRFFCLRILIC